MEVPYLLALHAIHGMNAKLLRTLLQFYHHDAKAAWRDYGNWSVNLKLSPSEAQTLCEQRSKMDVEAYYERFLASGATVVCAENAAYPPLLKEIYDAPYLLFYQGELPPPDSLGIAVVGSRHCTAYGRQAAENIATGLAELGFWIISGMARGIDAAAHRGALLGQGKTVAVLGSGIDVIYPRENQSLAKEIAASGCLLSEFPLGAEPLARHFPLRNRLISGLALGLLVVEGNAKSGSNITVDYAQSQGRDIFAVPGPIQSSLSYLPHRLIRNGAKLVERAADISEEYEYIMHFKEKNEQQQRGHKQIKTDTKRIQPVLKPGEEAILKLLTTPMHFDQLGQETGLDASSLAATLTLFEVRGLIKQLPGQYYVLGNMIL